MTLAVTKLLDGVIGQFWLQPSVGDLSALWIQEGDFTVSVVSQAEAALMNEAMMVMAQLHQVGQGGVSTLRPVLDMVGLDMAVFAAAREAATLIAGSQDTAQCRAFG